MNTAIARSVYKMIQRYRDEPVHEKLKYLEKTQWLSNEEIKNIQIQKLKEILLYSLKNVPYYQKILQPYAKIIFKLDSISQFTQLPILSKEEIQKNFLSLQSVNYKGKIATENTSGSTGDPFKFKLDRNASAFTRALSYREHRWYDIDIGEKEARFYGIPMDFVPMMKENFKDYLMNRKRFVVFDLSEKKLHEYYHIMNKYQPKYIYGYTSSICTFVKFLQHRKLKFKKPFLKAIITTSEVLHEEEKKIMESWMEVPVVNEYGTSELGIIAAQCPHGNMHLSSENVIVEIIRNGQPANAGESGEVILTGLNNYAMPLIRYAVGDVASLSTKICPCGRGLPLLEQIEGRVNNMVITPEGKISSGLVFYYISRSLIEKDAGVRKFKVIQNSLDTITFQIVKGSKFNDKNLLMLEKKTHEYLSPSMKVNFEFHNDIPHTSSGKIIHFISNLNSPFQE